MVEPQSSKLITRVRFPSSPPMRNAHPNGGRFSLSGVRNRRFPGPSRKSTSANALAFAPPRGDIPDLARYPSGMSPNEEVLLRIFIIVFPIVSGSAIVWTARACASGRIKRNWAIGIRFPSTMKSEDAWLACHRRAQRALTLGGLAMIAAGLAGLLPLALPASIAIVGAGALTMLGFVLYAAVAGVRAARALNE